MTEKIPYWKNKSIENLTDTVDGVLHIEEWREIAGYEEFYEVSNFGRVRSLDRVVAHKTSHKKTIRGKILCISEDSQGYLLANLWKHNKPFKPLVHRLVAQAFIPNPNNLPEVNHDFGDKKDNRPSKLSWITSSDNQKHSFRVLKRKGSLEGRFGSNNPTAKRVRCTSLDVDFGSVVDAANLLGLTQPAVSQVCLNIRKHAKGLVFKFIDN